MVPGCSVVAKKIVVELPELVVNALGTEDAGLNVEVLRRVVASLYAQGRIELSQAVDLLGMSPGRFAALVVDLRLSVGESDAQERERLWAEVQRMAQVARDTGLTQEEVDEEVRAVRNARRG